MSYSSKETQYLSRSASSHFSTSWLAKPWSGPARLEDVNRSLPVHACWESKERITKCRWDKLCGMSTHIAAFMVSMNSQVKTHHFVEFFILEAHHLSEIRRIIKWPICFRDSSFLVRIHIGNSCDFRDLSTEIKTILEGVLPIFVFINSAGICFMEMRVILESKRTNW